MSRLAPSADSCVLTVLPMPSRISRTGPAFARWSPPGLRWPGHRFPTLCQRRGVWGSRRVVGAEAFTRALVGETGRMLAASITSESGPPPASVPGRVELIPVGDRAGWRCEVAFATRSSMRWRLGPHGEWPPSRDSLPEVGPVTPSGPVPDTLRPTQGPLLP